MKIAINAIPYIRWSGIETFLYNILKFWPKNNKDEIIVFTNHGFAINLDGLPEQIKIRRINFKNNGRLGLFLYQQFILPTILIVEKFDILFCASLITPWLFTKKITTIHDAAPFVLKNENSLAGKIFWRINLWLGLLTSKKIITVSEFSKLELINHLKINDKKIAVIYNGSPIIEVATCPISNRTDRYIIALGNARPRKNLEIIFEAMKSIKKEFNDLKLIIIGKMDTRMSELKEKYSNDNIIFTGFIEENKKYCLIKNSLALIFPSLYEGFGLPIIEAGTLKTPVICSDIPSFREVAGNSALFFNPQDKNDLIEKIKIIYQSEEAARNLGNKGFINASRFNWRRSAEKLSLIINQYENITDK